MRKRMIRSGLRLVFAALLLIILASFYHAELGNLWSLTMGSEQRLYSLGIFWAAVLGGYGVVLAAFGLTLPGTSRDSGVRVLPVFLLILAAVTIFFYLLVAAIHEPPRPERLRPGETITI